MLYQQKRQTVQEYKALTAEYALFRENCEEKKQALEQASALYVFLRHAETRPVELKGTTLSPSARVIVYWNEKTESAYLNPISLPPAPRGKQYQIWADVEGEMINIGLLPKNGGEQLHALSFIKNAESLNITLEPEGGSKQPTVEQLYVNGEV